MLGKGDLEDGGVGQLERGLQRPVQMLEGGTVGRDEGRRVQLEWEAVGLGHVALGQLDMAEGVAGRLFRALGEGQVPGELGVRKAHGALGGQVQPHAAEGRTGVCRSLPREVELRGFGLR